MEQVPSHDIDLRRENWGCSNRGSCRISIDESLPPERRQQVRFHELIHVADLESCDSQDNLTEAQVDRLSRSLWTIIRDNPQLVDLLGFIEPDIEEVDP